MPTISRSELEMLPVGLWKETMDWQMSAGHWMCQTSNGVQCIYAQEQNATGAEYGCMITEAHIARVVYNEFTTV